MTPDDLRPLLALLRENGITYYEHAGTRIVLGPVAPAVDRIPPRAVDEDQETRLDRLAFGRLFSAAGVTRG